MTSGGDETLWLRASIKSLLDLFWKTELHNDVRDYIMYRNGEKRSDPRSEDEQKTLYEEIERIIDDFTDEIVEALNDRGIITIHDARRMWEEVRHVSHEKFGALRRRAWELVRSEIPAEEL